MFLHGAGARAQILVPAEHTFSLTECPPGPVLSNDAVSEPGLNSALSCPLLKVGPRERATVGEPGQTQRTSIGTAGDTSQLLSRPWTVRRTVLR